MKIANIHRETPTNDARDRPANEKRDPRTLTANKTDADLDTICMHPGLWHPSMMALPAPPLPQFVRYASAGAIGTALHYATLTFLVQAMFMGPVAGSTAGAVLGALVNYVLNHRFTFASRRAHGHALPRFATIAVAGIALNAAVLAAMLTVAGSHYLFAQVVATCVVLVAGYFANRTWTF